MLKDWPYEFPGTYWLDKAEDDAVLDVLHSRTLFRHYGPEKPKYVSKFETLACEYYGKKYALAVNSGTGALETALLALGIGPGCEVIIPSFMWIATVSTVVQRNAIPVICEVDDSFTINPADFEKKITKHTKLVVPVHMAGAHCNMDAVMEIAKKHGIKVLEDVAQANGGSFKGKKLGTFGDIGIFSLQTNKNITSGEGGFIITDDKILYERAFTGHDMGFLFDNGKAVNPPSHAVMWPTGRRFGELLGAVAYEQLKKLPIITEHMHASKKRIKELLKGTTGLSFRKIHDPAGDYGPFMIIMLETERKAIDAARKMLDEGLHNICRLADYTYHIYSNIHALVDKAPLSPSGNPWNLKENSESVYDYHKGACPKSDALFARSILIPIPSRLTEEQEKQAAEIIKQAVK